MMSKRTPFILLCLVLVSCAPVAVPVTPTAMPTTTPSPTAQPLPSATATPPPTATADNTLRILFVGNSYTSFNRLFSIVADLLAAGGHLADVQQTAPGGWSLSNHLYASTTLNTIDNGNWDYVILQEQSTLTNVEIGMYPAIRALDEHISAIGAETILFMNWGRRDGHPRAGYPDYTAAQNQIATNYFVIAQELDLRIAPVGLAWQRALAADPTLNLWNEDDGSHPNLAGSTLAAYIFYGLLTGETPQDFPLSEDLPTAFLQRIAAETLAQFQNK